jgi:methionine synthase I (cobalamin-dependent)
VAEVALEIPARVAYVAVVRLAITSLARTAALDATLDGAVRAKLLNAFSQMPGDAGRDAAIDVFAEQAAALVAGGADLIWVETMSDLAEIEAAIAGVRRAAPATPIVATMTFDTRGHTMMGVSPEQAVDALSALRVDALGGNCGNGPDELLPVVERMAGVAPGVPIVAKSNVGMPVFVDARAVYLTEPAAMATEAEAMRRAGATLIGACCGSTPAHLAAMRDALQPPG